MGRSPGLVDPTHSARALRFSIQFFNTGFEAMTTADLMNGVRQNRSAANQHVPPSITGSSALQEQMPLVLLIYQQ